MRHWFICALLLTAAGAGSGKAEAKPMVEGKLERVTEKADFAIRDTAEDAVFGGKMWMSNGYYGTNEDLYRDLWTSTGGQRWTKVLDSTPYDGYSEMVVFKRRLWAVKKSVWASTDGLRWERVLDNTPFGARSYGELVVFKNRMWQLGSGEDIWASADGSHWTCALPSAPFGKRHGSAVAAYKGNLWLMAGSTPETSDPPEKHYKTITTHNDVWSSPDGVKWARVLEHAPWDARTWTVAKAYAGKLWLIGGFDNRNSKNFAEIWYTEDGKDWRRFEADPFFSPRHEPTCYVYKGSLWIAAGNSWPLMNDVWRLTVK
ncbi:MAG: hypothetical protein IT210_12295 [Armatimonadetes bacterium]|nr:hypothetical protein [Armatimonadota bacterium]